MSKQSARLLERQVARQIKDYLQWHGWRLFRNQVMTAQNAAGGWIRAGEKGMPDLLFIYYFKDAQEFASCLCLWVETKREGEPLRPEQVEWHTLEIARGAVVVTVDNYERFRDWYEQQFAWLLASGSGQQSLLLEEGEGDDQEVL